MSKLKLGVAVGTGLGLLDGLLTFFSPQAVESGMMPMIITGSTVKAWRRTMPTWRCRSTRTPF